MELRFSWDEEKAAKNLRKHGVSFVEAAAAFSDPNALVAQDVRNDERWQTIGAMSEQLVVVVHEDSETLEDERLITKVRIISARFAVRAEIARYRDGVV